MGNIGETSMVGLSAENESLKKKERINKIGNIGETGIIGLSAENESLKKKMNKIWTFALSRSKVAPQVQQNEIKFFLMTSLERDDVITYSVYLWISCSLL